MNEEENVTKQSSALTLSYLGLSGVPQKVLHAVPCDKCGQNNWSLNQPKSQGENGLCYYCYSRMWGK